MNAKQINQQIKQQIKQQIANGYAETHVGYHADFRSFEGGEFQRGAYAQIAELHGGTYRIYAASYAELLAVVQERATAGEL